MFKTEKKCKIIAPVIANGSITEDKIADGAVTEQKLGVHRYRHSFVCEDKDGQYKFAFDWFCDTAEAITAIGNIPNADDKQVAASGFFKYQSALYIIYNIEIDTNHDAIYMNGGNLTANESQGTEIGRYTLSDNVTQLI